MVKPLLQSTIGLDLIEVVSCTQISNQCLTFLHKSHYVTSYTATFFIVVVDLQQLHTETPIRFLIIFGAKEFTWYKTQRHTRVTTRSFSSIF